MLLETNLRKVQRNLAYQPVEGHGANWSDAGTDAYNKLNAKIQAVLDQREHVRKKVNTAYDVTVQHGIQQQNWSQQVEDQLFVNVLGLTPSQIKAQNASSQ
jgi:hypothetical protein